MTTHRAALTPDDLPTPVLRASRICYGVAYFTNEADADLFARYIQQQGHTYNGGWMDGCPCGREPSQDIKAHPEHGRLYAVTTR